MPLAQFSVSFQPLPPLPRIKLGPSGASSWVDELVYVLWPCGYLQWTVLWGWEFFQPQQFSQVFTARGFEALFPHARNLGCMVCLTPQLFFPAYPHANVGLPAPPAACLPHILSTLAAHLPPPTCLDEHFFLNSLIVGLPHSLIFWQFWLFSVFKFVLVLPLVVWGGTVCLHRGWKSKISKD